MQPPFTVRQLEPYILQKVFLPTQQSSFIKNLIVSYNKKLSLQNDSFYKQFMQKQQKLQRHKQQLNLLPQMKTDPELMNQVIEEIQLKDYEKEYQSILADSEKKPVKFLNRKVQKSVKYNSMDKQNVNKTFHVTRRNLKKDNSVDNSMKNTKRDQSLFNITEANKKFRSSVIKSSSFSAIKRAKTPFTTNTNINFESIRNSEDVALPQQGLKNYFNLKDNKLSEALYGKRPQSKGLKREHQQQQGNLKRKNISNLSPQWTREFPEKQKNMILKKNQIFKNSVNDDMKVQFQEFQCEKEVDKNRKQLRQQRQQQQQKIEVRLSFEEQLQKRNLMERQGQSKRSYQTKMQLMAKNLQSSREDKQSLSNPYHISNFIKQLNTYHTNSHSAHHLGKLNKSKRRIVVDEKTTL